MPLPKADSRAAAVVMLLLLASTVSSAEELINRAEWPQLRQGVNVIQHPVLQRVVNDYERSEGGRIVIRYPGGDRGNAWAIDLRDWLVALGISSGHILLEPGSGIPETMVVHVEATTLP